MYVYTIWGEGEDYNASVFLMQQASIYRAQDADYKIQSFLFIIYLSIGLNVLITTDSSKYHVVPSYS